MRTTPITQLVQYLLTMDMQIDTEKDLQTRKSSQISPPNQVPASKKTPTEATRSISSFFNSPHKQS